MTNIDKYRVGPIYIDGIYFSHKLRTNHNNLKWIDYISMKLTPCQFVLWVMEDSIAKVTFTRENGKKRCFFAIFINFLSVSEWVAAISCQMLFYETYSKKTLHFKKFTEKSAESSIRMTVGERFNWGERRRKVVLGAFSTLVCTSSIFSADLLGPCRPWWLALARLPV